MGNWMKWATNARLSSVTSHYVAIFYIEQILCLDQLGSRRFVVVQQFHPAHAHGATTAPCHVRPMSSVFLPQNWHIWTAFFTEEVHSLYPTQSIQTSTLKSVEGTYCEQGSCSILLMKIGQHHKPMRCAPFMASQLVFKSLPTPRLDDGV